MSKIKDEVEEFKRKLLAERLAQCTEAQQRMFNKVYPEGVLESKLESAIDLCDRTIRKNIAGRTHAQDQG